MYRWATIFPVRSLLLLEEEASDMNRLLVLVLVMLRVEPLREGENDSLRVNPSKIRTVDNFVNMVPCNCVDYLCLYCCILCDHSIDEDDG